MLNNDLKKEVLRMCAGVFILSAVMVIIFAVFGKFDLPVLYGALLGTAVTLVNYFLLALSIQHIASKEDEASAKLLMNISYFARIIIVAVAIIIAIKLPCFNYIAAILPLVFQRIVIMVIHATGKGAEYEHNRS